MMPIHDLRCSREHLNRDQAVVIGDLPPCWCGSVQTISWEHGQPPATDVMGAEQYSEVLGLHYTSSRHRDKQMKARGFEPCGDKTHGARELPRRDRPNVGDPPSRKTVESTHRAWMESRG